MAKRDIERALRKKGITAESIRWVSTPTPGENVMTWEIKLAEVDADTFCAYAWNFFGNTAEALEWVNELKPCAACRICGCTETNACPGGCWWVEPDLCSACHRAMDHASR